MIDCKEIIVSVETYMASNKKKVKVSYNGKRFEVHCASEFPILMDREILRKKTNRTVLLEDGQKLDIYADDALLLLYPQEKRRQQTHTDFTQLFESITQSSSVKNNEYLMNELISLVSSSKQLALRTPEQLAVVITNAVIKTISDAVDSGTKEKLENGLKKSLSSFLDTLVTSDREEIIKQIKKYFNL